MKTMRYLMMMLAMLAMSVSMVGCGSDDDDDYGDESSILGTWITEDSSDTYVFKGDGTGTLTNKSGVMNFKYTYSASERTLKWWYVDSDKVYNYSVQRTGNTLMLTAGSTTVILTRK